MNRKQYFLRLSRRILVILFAFIAIFFASFSFESNKPITISESNVTKWDGDIPNTYNITTISKGSNVKEYVTFTDFITNLSRYKNKNNSTYAIVIETALDMERISMLCNDVSLSGITISEALPVSYYLSLNYVVGDNITFAGQSIYPIGNADTPFTGSFDGQGFALSNLFIAYIDTTKYLEYYQNVNEDDTLVSYGLFGYTSSQATISNVRFINLQASQIENINGAIAYAAPLVGTNNGTISNVSSEQNNEIGYEFCINSDVIVASLVAINNGTINNSFVTTTNGYFTTQDNSYALTYPVVYQNNGSLNNVYYDAEKFIPEMEDFNDSIIAIPTTAGFQVPSNFATGFVNNWFFNSSYSDTILTSTYPVLQGLRLYKDSIDTYAINKASDLVAFSKLVSEVDTMATRNYILTNCIDMGSLSSSAYSAPRNTFSGKFSSEIVDNDTDCNYSHNFSNATVKYHAIWDLNISKASLGDITSYGLFGAVSGVIENINLINVHVNTNDLSNYSNNTVYISSLVGELKTTGIINNVNVYGDINIPTSTTSNRVGAFYIGGLVGHMYGKINASTNSGVINGGVHYYTNTNKASTAIGGVVGLSESSAIIQNSENYSTIVGVSYSNTSATDTQTYLGGLVGKGVYSNLVGCKNNGELISHDNAIGHVAKIYIGGIFSVLTSTACNINKVYNAGDIHMMVNDSTNIADYYVAGIGTLSTGSTASTTITNITNAGSVSLDASFNYSNNNYTFNSSFSGYSNIRRGSSGTTENPTSSTSIGGAIKLTAGIIIGANTAADIHGAFNDGNQVVELGILFRYAPIVFSLNESTNRVINVNKAYNSGNITYVTTLAMYNQKYMLYGNTYGNNIDFNYLRNTGTITAEITKASTNTFSINGSDINKYAFIAMTGLVGSLKDGYQILNSYNGGEINFFTYTDDSKTTLSTKGSTTLLNYMLYISAIAFTNYNETDVEPSSSVMISSLRQGAIHNCLNDGNININASIYGCSRVGGMCSINNGLISNSFNTGDIYNYVALDENPSEYGESEVETGGIACLIASEYGQVMDCANYGKIFSISPHTGGEGWVNASGIVGRNDKAEANGNLSKAGWKGKIEFCVNYGDIYAWNAYTETFAQNLIDETSTTSYCNAESGCKAAGMLSIGVINIINCANYGNIYSRYIGGGIFGLVDGSKFTSINKEIYIANSINYGHVRPITTYNDNAEGINKFTVSNSVPNGSTYNGQRINAMFGALIGFIYGTSSSWSRTGSTGTWNEGTVSMLSYLHISFLINFDDQTNIIGSQTLCNSTLSDTQTKKYSSMVQYMATTKQEDTSMYPFNSNSTRVASYNGVEYGIKSYGLGSANGEIFGEDFPLRAGELDTTIETNGYVRDYISFVEYEYTNKLLVDRLFNASSRIGIYAIASSKGILNGQYIPDNIVWGDENHLGLNPVENGEVQTEWLGEVENTSSIRYKFSTGMKQLNRSIATTIYDLQLVSVNGTTVLDGPVIDTEDKVVTFYVGDNQGAEEGVTNIIGSYNTYSGATVDQNNKTITIRNGSNIIVQYSYATGALVRIDNNDTFIVPTAQNSVQTQVYTYSEVMSYTQGSITNYYVTEDDGLTYRPATNDDRLYTLTNENTTSRSRYSRSTNSDGYYRFTRENGNASGRYNVVATEYTNRNNGGSNLYIGVNNPSGTTGGYYDGVGNTVPSRYKLYNRSQQNISISYPTSVRVYNNGNSNYYANYYKVNTTSGSYALSEGATLNIASAEGLRVGVPAALNGEIVTNLYASSIGTIGTNDYLIVNSAAGTTAEYEIRVVRSGARSLESVVVTCPDWNVNSYTTSGGSITLMNGANNVSIDKSDEHTMTITEITKNIADNVDLLLGTKLKKYNNTTNSYEDCNVITIKGKESYSLTGGVVSNKSENYNAMTGEYDSAPIQADGTFPDASVEFNFTYGPLMEAGRYRIVISMGNNEYYVQFDIAKSNDSRVIDLTYVDNFEVEEGTWINSDNQNATLTEIQYDYNISHLLTPIATNIAIEWDNINLNAGAYLSNVSIANYATITSITYSKDLAKNHATAIRNLGGANYTNDNYRSYVYIITFNLKAEDDSTSTFTQYFVEKLIDTSIQYVYMDGINQGVINSVEFVRTNEPTIKVFYDFAGVNFSDTDSFNVDIQKTYDTTRYPNGSGNAENADIASSIDYTVSATGVTLIFTNDVACDYVIRVSYTRDGETDPSFIYQQFTVSKTNNTDSLLSRVLFNSDAKFTSMGNIIYNGYEIGTLGSETYFASSTATTNQDLLTSDIYYALYNNDNLRKIKSMPNMIYYNNEAPRRLTDPNNANIIYNRYDLVGYVSETDITDFTPTFILPVGATIYQLDENNNPIVDENNNIVLASNFVDDSGSSDFYFVHYRVYSEASSVDNNGYCIPNALCDNYTDYYIAIVDMAYNVYFDIVFQFVDGAEDELTENGDSMLVTFYRRNIDDNNFMEDAITTSSSMYYFFRYNDENEASLSTYGHRFSATSAGFFELVVDLPNGYSYTYTFSNDDPLVEYDRNGIFYVPRKIIAYRYQVTITVGKTAVSDTPWGQQGSITIVDIYDN